MSIDRSKKIVNCAFNRSPALEPAVIGLARVELSLGVKFTERRPPVNRRSGYMKCRLKR
ncbi:hypothetical protein HAX54_019067, partial [Datura stramonium]|nr:hypothetical protein [Datura stramonium]